MTLTFFSLSFQRERAMYSDEPMVSTAHSDEQQGLPALKGILS